MIFHPPYRSGSIARGEAFGLRQTAAAFAAVAACCVRGGVSEGGPSRLRPTRSRLRPPQSGSRLPQSKGFAAILAILIFTLPLLGLAEDKADSVPKPRQFPPPNSGHYIAGDIVTIDPMNRRGSLRPDGTGKDDTVPLHSFAMLPYGMLYYNGAPAELRDLPIGTHVHGYFFVPPPGEEATVPPLPAHQAKFQSKYNHALSLEDDVSFYQRRGQTWKVVSLDQAKGKLKVVSAGQAAPDGISGGYQFDIDDVTRVWKGRRLVDLREIAPETEVRFNLTWAQGWRDREYTVAEIWLDAESWDFAADLQRRRHVRYERQRWVPGWIDSVENFDFGGGIVTLTLFGGMDQTLYNELKASQAAGFGVAVAEKTLRTWAHRSDKKIGQVLEWKDLPNPPPGSSGQQIRLKFQELLDGYRPGRIVRVKSIDWIFVTIPTEERMKSLEDREP